MASTNQEQTSVSGHSQLNMQRQQQDLVKLLAQHFHHQFYQLANSGQISGTTSTTTSTTNPRLQNLPNFQAPPLGPHYSNEAPILNGSSVSGFDLSGMNLVTNANNQLLHNHILRSQATNTGLLNSLSSSGSSGGPESLIDFSIRNSLNPYSLNDVNLFHALGLNLTNNQLVLSLQQQQQQQQLLQQQQTTNQSAANRQYEESRDEVVSEQQELRQTSSGRNSNDTAISNLIDPEDNHADGKEMLKFSINTILGRGGSPQAGPGFKTSRAHHSISKQVSDVGKSNHLIENANEMFKIKRNGGSGEREEQLSATECDSNDSCSDSSLINASTPIPQTSNSILFGPQTIHPPEDRNASLNVVPLAVNNQPPSRNHIQAHQRPAHHALQFLPGSSAFPWTVAARGKPRRGMMRRAVFSDSQRVGLEKRFQLQKYISKPDRKKLAEKLGLRDSQVKIWFQNRRMKWRNSKERELLSAGGSREQTLPTRNNPNPDLSDVGETIKRITANNGPASNDMNNK